MNEEINEIFEQWKQFLSWCYENNDKTTEIHRDSLERVMAYTRQLENIIKEVREEVRIYEEQSKDGITNELDNYVFVQRLKNVLDKGE